MGIPFLLTTLLFTLHSACIKSGRYGVQDLLIVHTPSSLSYVLTLLHWVLAYCDIQLLRGLEKSSDIHLMQIYSTSAYYSLIVKIFSK